ncbi:hypothetical protein DRO97_02985, partial [Archaeoglobales archaeon]
MSASELEKELKNLRLGKHLCYTYRNKEEQLSIVIPFMIHGLKKNEKCLYIVDENTKEEIIEAFRKFIDIDEYIRSKQFVILTKEEAYLKDGYFDPDKMIELLKEAERQAIKEGYAGLRATGEMTWVFTRLPGVEKLIEYEAKLNYFFPKSRCVAICQYNENKFDAEMLLDVILTHPKLIIYDSLCENPYYIPPDVFLARMKKELSKEIYERLRNEISYKRKIEDKLKEKEKKYRELFELIPDMVLILDLDGNIVEVNATAEKITGYSREELLKMNVKQLLSDYDAKKADERIKQVIKDGYAVVELKRKRKDGTFYYAEVHARLIDYNGRKAILSIDRNITQRKELEEKLKLYKEIFDNSNDGIAMIDLNGYYIEQNSAHRELLGYSDDELRGKTPAIHMGEEQFSKIYEELSKRGLYRGEILCYKKDGTPIYVELSAFPVKDSKGNIVCYVGIKRDITEKKKLENQLKESEEMFRTLAEKSLVGIYLIQDGVFKYVNPKLAEDFGYEVDEIVGKDVLFFIHPEDRELVDRNLRLRIEGKVESIRYKPKVVRKDGQIRIFEVLGSRMMYKGKPAVFGTAIDITEQESYRKKLEEYKRFYENAQDLFFILDKKGRILDVNPKFAEMLGYEIDELLGHTSRRIVHPDDLERLKDFFNEVLKGVTKRDEFRFITKEGKTLWLEILEWPVFENNEVVKVEGVTRDITEKKKLEKELKESEEKYRLIVENSRDVIVTVDTNGIRTYVSPSVEKVLGYKPKEMVGKSVFEYVHPDDMDFVKSEFFNAVKERRSGKVQHRYKRKDGRWIWMESVGSPIFSNGDFIGGVIIARDVTERVKLEMKLRESEARYKETAELLQRMIDIAPVAITGWDLDFRINLWNKAAEKLFGWRADEVMGKDLLELQVPEREKDRVREVIEEVMRSGTSKVNINENFTKDGQKLIVEWYNFAVKDADGKIVGVASIGVDLTKRIEMERKIRESEEKYRKIFENSPNIVAIVNKDGVFVEANPKLIKTLGISPVGKSHHDLFPSDVAKIRVKLIKEVIEQERSITLEDERNGKYFLTSLIPIELPEGKHCLVISQEVTKMIRLNRLLNAINNINKLIVHEKDKQKLLEKACEELFSLKDYSTVTICLVENEEIIPIAVSGEKKEVILEKQKECKIIKEAIKRKLMLAKSEKECFGCVVKRDEFKQVLVIPMIVDNEIKGVITLYLTTDKRIGDEEIDLLKTMAEDLAFAIKVIELDESKRKAYEQIEKNIEQFAILVDHIRNPLAAIMALAELEVENKETAEKIIKQVE